MIKSILYATDLGLYSPYVLQHALLLARKCEAELYVVHVVEPMGLFAESVLNTYLDEAALKKLRSKGLSAVMANIESRVLEGFRDVLGENQQDVELIHHVSVVQGDPFQAILDEARKLAVDLLVVGSHSHGAVNGARLGRTAGRILELSEIPVYLVPMLQQRPRGDT
jgi:nucleotide-binding universal stress UspA family protein